MTRHVAVARRSVGPLIAGLAMAALVLTAGCGDLLKQPYPAKALFSIDPGLPVATGVAGAATRPSTAILLVRAVRVSPPYDGLSVVTRTGPDAYDLDYYDQYVAAPNALLTGGLTDWLAASLGDPGGRAVRVVGAGTSVRPDLTLDGEISRLLVDRTGGGPPRAVVAGRFYLTREGQGETEVVFGGSYAETAEVIGDTPAGRAHAIGVAYRHVLKRLAADVAGVMGGG